MGQFGARFLFSHCTGDERLPFAGNPAGTADFSGFDSPGLSPPSSPELVFSPVVPGTLSELTCAVLLLSGCGGRVGHPGWRCPAPLTVPPSPFRAAASPRCHGLCPSSRDGRHGWAADGSRGERSGAPRTWAQAGHSPEGWDRVWGDPEPRGGNAGKELVCQQQPLIAPFLQR